MIEARPFGERESADSMTAAAARLGVPLSVIKYCKRQGCPAFRGSRVYLRPLAEMIACGEAETDTILFPLPAGSGARIKTISEFRELLRVSIRCGFLQASEIFEILIKEVIESLDSQSRAVTSARTKRELEEFEKLIQAIQVGFVGVSCI